MCTGRGLTGLVRFVLWQWLLMRCKSAKPKHSDTLHPALELMRLKAWVDIGLPPIRSRRSTREAGTLSLRVGH